MFTYKRKRYNVHDVQQQGKVLVLSVGKMTDGHTVTSAAQDAFDALHVTSTPTELKELHLEEISMLGRIFSNLAVHLQNLS